MMRRMAFGKADLVRFQPIWPKLALIQAGRSRYAKGEQFPKLRSILSNCILFNSGTVMIS